MEKVEVKTFTHFGKFCSEYEQAIDWLSTNTRLYF